jgi:hypothetical protein
MGRHQDAAMIPYQVDPSLHPDRPAPPQLDDGFSPPARRAGAPGPSHEQHADEDASAVEASLSAKSEF